MATQAIDPSVVLQARGVTYLFIVVATIVVYDFLTNLDDELDYLLNSRTTLTKVLFFGCRYMPFVICALHVPMAFGNAKACIGLAISTIMVVSCVILLLCAECVFVLRTYALWNCDRRVRTALLIGYLPLFLSSMILLVACGVVAKDVTFTPGCYSGPVSGNYILAPYIILLVLEIEVVYLTFYRMIKYYYATRCRLLTLVTQYSLGYILAGLFLTVMNIVAILFIPGVYGPVLEAVQVVVHGLLVTRMQLDLWKLDPRSIALNPTSELNESGLTNLEMFELSQRVASFVPSGTV